MYRAFLLLAAAALSVPAYAADTSQTERAHHKPHITWQQHFEQANVAHDGHLTLQEAKVGYPGIVKNFDVIDASHKGYITEDDIRAWHRARRAAHKLNHSSNQNPAKKSSSATMPSRPVTNASASIVDVGTLFAVGAHN